MGGVRRAGDATVALARALSCCVLYHATPPRPVCGFCPSSPRDRELRWAEAGPSWRVVDALGMIRCRADCRFGAGGRRVVAAPRGQVVRSGAAEGAAAPRDAFDVLTEFTKRDVKRLRQPMCDTPEGRAALRSSLLEVVSRPRKDAAWDPARDPILFGIVSSDIRLACRALRDYCEALGHPYVVPTCRERGVSALPLLRGGVYVKHNTATGLCYATSYSGPDRGVLVQLGEAQFGHLPLGLFDEDRTHPPPPMQ